MFTTSHTARLALYRRQLASASGNADTVLKLNRMIRILENLI